MNVLSLFDGISCARVALERAGIEVDHYFASEVDKYAMQIAQKNYPDTGQLGSVIGLMERWLAPRIDLMVGGSPCQDLSIAQKNRQGLAGERSGLFWEYVRIRDFIKPKYFILENVASMSKEAKQTITEALGVEPVMINAALVSAQNRKRLFWVGRLVKDKYEQVVIPQPEDRGIYLKDVLEDNPDIAPQKSNTVRSSGRGSGLGNKHNWDTIRIGHFNKGGQGDRVYSPEGKSVGLSALGGGGGAKTGLYQVAEVVRKLTPIEGERLQGLPDNYTEGVSNSQRYKMLGNGFNCDVVAHIISHLETGQRSKSVSPIISIPSQLSFVHFSRLGDYGGE